METNRWIELSQRFYRRLLHLYPQNYRGQYETEMFHLFADQCRDAYQSQGRLGILSLWPRTLVDVGITVTREHLADPQAKLGLLDAKPNEPLPWKGVLLVLIPGLIFFISQIAQLTSSNDWFFLVFYRAAYYLILPVLLVWLFTRRFPVWGLIPVGLLYSVLGSYHPGQLIGKLHLPIASLYPSDTAIDFSYLVVVSVCAALLGILIWYFVRRQEISHAAWRWLAFYGLLVIFQISGQIWNMVDGIMTAQGLDWQTVMNIVDIKQNMVQISLWYVYSPLLFLLLVFIGKLFARKYGGLSFLLMLGYLLPIVIFGRYGEWNNALPFYLVSSAVLLYRFIVALIGPIWLVRAASKPRRQRAATIPITIAVICHISLNLFAYLAMIGQFDLPVDLLNLIIVIWKQVMIAVGLGLAIALYLPKDQTITSPPVPAIAA